MPSRSAPEVQGHRGIWFPQAGFSTPQPHLRIALLVQRSHGVGPVGSRPRDRAQARLGHTSAEPEQAFRQPPLARACSARPRRVRQPQAPHWRARRPGRRVAARARAACDGTAPDRESAGRGLGAGSGGRAGIRFRAIPRGDRRRRRRGCRRHLRRRGPAERNDTHRTSLLRGAGLTPSFSPVITRSPNPCGFEGSAQAKLREGPVGSDSGSE